MTQNETHTENGSKGTKIWLPCERCANRTQHIVRASVEVSENDEFSENQVWQQFQVVECIGCRWLSFRHEWSASDDLDISPATGDERPVIHEQLYPARLVGRRPIEDGGLPAKVRAIYREAHFALRNGQRILAAIGVRALVEAVCSAKGASRGNLDKRIDELVTMGVLAPDGASVLHGTRLLGNQAAHEVLPPPEEVLVAAIQVAEHLLQSVYILPKLAGRFPKK